MKYFRSSSIPYRQKISQAQIFHFLAFSFASIFNYPVGYPWRERGMHFTIYFQSQFKFYKGCSSFTILRLSDTHHLSLVYLSHTLAQKEHHCIGTMRSSHLAFLVLLSFYFNFAYSLVDGNPAEFEKTEVGQNLQLISFSEKSSHSGCELARVSCKNRWMTKVGKKRYRSGWKLSFRPTRTARLFAYTFRGTVWKQFKKCLRFPSLTTAERLSIYQQFVCHAYYGTGGCTWDFESTRPPYKYYLNPLKKCNW